LSRNAAVARLVVREPVAVNELPAVNTPLPVSDSPAVSAVVALSGVPGGGSWDYDQVNARCSSRLGFDPYYRYGYHGFRVVVRSAPVS